MSYRIAAALAFGLLATQASAGIVIDDFEYYDAALGFDPGYGFDPVIAYSHSGGGRLTATGTSSNGTIAGGDRDVAATVISGTGYPGDNSDVEIRMGNGRSYGGGFGGMGVALGGEGRFAYTYDGAGVGDGAVGLGLDLAATGDRLRITTYYAAVIGDNGNPLVPLTLTLTDQNGRTVALSDLAQTNAVYGLSYDYLFSDFESANALFDLHNVSRITLSAQYRSASYFDTSLDINNIGTTGAAYTTRNVIPSAVPEPASWAMMLGAFGLIGVTLRRRRISQSFSRS